MPLFFDDIDTLFGNKTEIRQQAISVCGGSTNFQCLFDYVMTADSQAVRESQLSLMDYEREQKQLSKFGKRFFMLICDDEQLIKRICVIISG